MNDGVEDDGVDPPISDDLDGSSGLPGEAGTDSLFWDLLLYAAICAVGAGAAVALRRQPWAVAMALVAAVVVLVVLASRRAGRRWTLRDYAMSTGFVIACVGFAVVAFLLVWVSVCSC